MTRRQACRPPLLVDDADAALASHAAGSGAFQTDPISAESFP
jgi:hypothetical protein